MRASRHGFESILDFGCGFGRVLRMLKAAYPEARLTAADVKREGVDFCARRHLGVSIASPAWVFDQVAELTALRLVMFSEGAWGPQDVVGCMRGPFAPSLPRAR